MDVAKTVELEFNNGQKFELHMTPQLVEQVVKAFNLSGPEEITDRHVKNYVVEGLKKALSSANERHTS